MTDNFFFFKKGKNEPMKGVFWIKQLNDWKVLYGFIFLNFGSFVVSPNIYFIL